jgi:hypothetical protein
VTTSSPGRPRVLRGALVAYASAFLGPVPNVIAFQYNPDSLTRTLRHRVEQRPGTAPAGRAAAGDPVKVTGPPEESLSLTVSLDATDDLEEASPLAVTLGLHPVLAALELLLYPESTQVLRNQTLALAGASSTPPAEVPSVLLVWGLGRVVPVRVDALSVTETAYDTRLNPIRADVELSLQVLTYLDLPTGSLGHGASLAHHVAKEVVARLNLVDTAATAVGQVP